MTTGVLALARNSTATNERLRYYFAAASARDTELARATLALTLTNELPDTIVTGMINAVASAGEHPQLAWDFVQANFDTLLARQGPNFRDQFVPNFMINFTDQDHAAQLAAFAPSQSTSGGRVMVARALQAIAISADLSQRVLPAADAWIRASATPVVMAKLRGKRPPSVLGSYRAAQRTLLRYHGRLGVPWGEVNRFRRGALDLPANGGPDVLRALEDFELEDDGTYAVNSGDSLVIFVEWDRAGRQTVESIHQFGSATLDARSPHYADQVPLFLSSRPRPCRWTATSSRRS